MALQVHRNFFESKDQVLDDIKADDFWPTTFVSNASPALPIHWHDSEIHGYVPEGTSFVRDGETGEALELHPGDKLVLPRGALHAERETKERVVYIVAIPEPRPVEQFLRMHPPDDAER